MNAIIESFELEVYPLCDVGKLDISGTYNFYPQHPLVNREYETVSIQKILLNGFDITRFMEHIVFEWNDENYWEKLEELALDHCRTIFRSTNELDSYTENQ